MDGDRRVVDGSSSNSLVDGNKTHFRVMISSDNKRGRIFNLKKLEKDQFEIKVANRPEATNFRNKTPNGQK